MSGRRLWCIMAFMASVSAGCTTSNQRASGPVANEPKDDNQELKTPPETLPKVPTSPPAKAPTSPPAAAPDDSPKEGELVRHTGRLDMDRLAGGKRLQATVLYLDDGRQVLLSYRPVEKWYKFIDKRVVVQGRHYTNPPHVQSVRADHFRVSSIALAPGETPHPVAPTKLPTPDTVRTRAELEAHDGRWVQLFATLKTGSRHADDDWCDAVALLGDGTEVWTSMYKSSFNRVWKPLFGKQVTLIGRAHHDKKDAKRPWKLIAQVAVCPGKSERCGMDQDVHTRNRGPIKIR